MALPGSVHCVRGSIELITQKVQAEYLAVKDHDLLGHCAPCARGSSEQRRHICNKIPPRIGTIVDTYYYTSAPLTIRKTV
jgi:hypothetical protein